MKNMLTEREEAALAQVAKDYGRRWKQELRGWWENGNYPSWLDSGALQTLRNSGDFGPSGLINFRLPKA